MFEYTPLGSTKEGLFIGDSFDKVFEIYGKFSKCIVEGEFTYLYFSSLLLKLMDNIVVGIAYLN